MREAILRAERRGLLWTIWRMFCRVLIVKYHLPFRLHRNTRKRNSITQCLVNSCKYTSRRNPSIRKTSLVFFNSSTCIAIAKGILATLYNEPTNHSQRSRNAYYIITLKEVRMPFRPSVTWIAVIWHRTQGRSWIRLSADRYSAWTRQKTTLFSRPLSP